MCNCSRPVGYRKPSPPIPHTFYAVMNGDTQVSGRFRSESLAEAKRLKLCQALPAPCELTVELV